MRTPRLATACFLMVALAAAGQSQERQSSSGGSSTSSSSYGNSSSTYGTSSSTRGTSTSTHGTSTSTYGTSSNTYGTSSNTYGTSSNTYGNSSGSQTRRSTRSTPLAQPRMRERSRNRLYLPIIVVGRVVVEGAERPPESVVIRMSCGGASIPQDYTDRRGRFSFQPGCNPVMAMSDASARGVFFGGPGGGMSSSRGMLNLSHCWLFVDLPGYRSNHVGLQFVRPMDRNAVGPIVLTRIEGSTGSTVSVTTLEAPKNAKKAYNKGLKALRSVEEPDYQKAVSHLERAVEFHPEFAAAWEALGRARMGLADEEGARKAFSRSIHSDPWFLQPYVPLIDMATERHEWTELESLADRYLALSPGSMRIRYLNGVAAVSLGKMSKAESMIRMIKNAGEMNIWSESYVILAAVHSSRAEFEEAAKHYEAYLKLSPTGETADQVKRILYDWRTLQVIDEDGVKLSVVPQPGDTRASASN